MVLVAKVVYVTSGLLPPDLPAYLHKAVGVILVPDRERHPRVALDDVLELLAVHLGVDQEVIAVGVDPRHLSLGVAVGHEGGERREVVGAGASCVTFGWRVCPFVWSVKRSTARVEVDKAKGFFSPVIIRCARRECPQTTSDQALSPTCRMGMVSLTTRFATLLGAQAGPVVAIGFASTNADCDDGANLRGIPRSR